MTEKNRGGRPRIADDWAHVTLRIPKDLHRQASRDAARMGITFADYMRRALTEKLERVAE